MSEYVNTGGRHCTADGLIVNYLEYFTPSKSDLDTAGDKFVPRATFERKNASLTSKLRPAVVRTSLVTTAPTMRPAFAERLRELEGMRGEQLRAQAIAHGIRPGNASKAQLVRAILEIEEYVDKGAALETDEPQPQPEPAEAADEADESEASTIEDRSEEFMALTLDELREYARENGYNLGGASKKTEIVEALLRAEGWYDSEESDDSEEVES